MRGSPEVPLCPLQAGVFARMPGLAGGIAPVAPTSRPLCAAAVPLAAAIRIAATIKDFRMPVLLGLPVPPLGAPYRCPDIVSSALME